MGNVYLPARFAGLRIAFSSTPPSIANASQLAAAKRLRREIQVVARGWRNPRAAAASGYDTAVCAAPGCGGLYLHAEHRGNSNDGLYFSRDSPKR